MPAKSSKISDLGKFVITEAKKFPEAEVSNPWGETALGVKKKNFRFLREEDGKLSFSVKLPKSANQALAMPFAAPTGYGLGRHGWITITLDKVPAGIKEQIEDWLLESYCAVAPKTLAARAKAGR